VEARRDNIGVGGGMSRFQLDDQLDRNLRLVGQQNQGARF
jgi:hypothetical protein